MWRVLRFVAACVLAGAGWFLMWPGNSQAPALVVDAGGPLPEEGRSDLGDHTVVTDLVGASSTAGEADPLARIEVAQQHSLQVRVNSGGKPLPAASVIVLRWDAAGQQEASRLAGLSPATLHNAMHATTNAQGTAEVAVPRVDLIVGAAGASFAPTLQVVDIDVDAVTLDLTEGVDISGHVVADGPGSPRVAGARVTARYPYETTHGELLNRLAGMLFPARTVTDDAGEFHLRGLPPGRLWIAAVKEGYCGEAHVTTVPLSAPLGLTLMPGGTLSGQVVAAATGEPIDAAVVMTVQMYGDFQFLRSEASYTAIDGTFEVGAVAAEGAAVSVNREGYGTVALDVQRLSANERRTLRIELPPAAMPLLGEIVSTTGRSLGAVVQVIQESDGLSVATLVADENGAFVCDLLQAGRSYRLQATHADHEPAVASGVVVGTDQPTHLELRMRPYAIVRGLVTKDGEPLTGGQVRLLGKNQDGRTRMSPYADVGADGTFEFRQIQAVGGVSYELMALVDGAAPTILSIEAPDPPHTDDEVHEIKLEHGVPLHGLLLDEDTGRPIPGATMQLCEFLPDGRMRETIRLEVKCDDEGRFRLDALPAQPGSLGLIVDQEPYAWRAVPLPSPMPTNDSPFIVRVPVGATLDVGMWHKDGQAVQRFDVWLTAPNKASLLYGYLEPPGGYGLVPRIDIGEWRLAAEVIADFIDPSSIGTRTYRDITLKAGEHRVERFELAELATVRGRVVSEQLDVSQRRWQVFAYSAENGGLRCYAEANDRGEFALKGVPAGDMWIRAETSDGDPRWTAQVPVLVTPGVDQEVELRLIGAELAGVVLDARGRPVDDATIRFHHADGATPEHLPMKAVSDQDGRFALAGLAAGPWAYEAVATGHGRQEGAVQIGAVGDVATLRITLADAAIVRVSVNDAAGNEVAAASVAARRAIAGARSHRPDRLDASGRRVFDTLAEGEYEITATATGFFPATAVVMAPAGQALDVTLTLRRPGDLLVRLKDFDGSLLKGEPFDVIDLTTNTSAAVWLTAGLVAVDTGALVTGSNGTTLLRGLPAGRYELKALDQTQRFEVIAGEQVDKTMLRLP